VPPSDADDVLELDQLPLHRAELATEDLRKQRGGSPDVAALEAAEGDCGRRGGGRGAEHERRGGSARGQGPS